MAFYRARIGPHDNLHPIGLFCGLKEMSHGKGLAQSQRNTGTQKSCFYLQKLKTELPYDPAILLLGIYPEELKVEEIFVHLLFTRARRWKQPKCSPADEGINRMKQNVSDITCAHTHPPTPTHTPQWNFFGLRKEGNSDTSYNTDKL